MNDFIPVYDPGGNLGPNERAALLDAFDTDVISGSGGRYIAQFENEFSSYCGCAYGVACSSGSTALHLAACCVGLRPGDEVLVSALTNIATANAIALRGARVVPVDSEPNTWNMDVRLLDDLITPRTRAIFPVHIYGHPVNMKAVWETAVRNNLWVVEDAAEAHGASCFGQRVGSWGDIGCFSFYANKVITTGEGGMIVTNSKEVAAEARLLRNLAFREPRFSHARVGFNYRMTNMQAAIGSAQMKRIDLIVRDKRRLADRYRARLQNVPGLRLPVEAEWAFNVYWMYCIVLTDRFRATRDELMKHLADHQIETRTMFCPLNTQHALLKDDFVEPIACPVAEDLWHNGLYLPSSWNLTDEQLDRICDLVKEAA